MCSLRWVKLLNCYIAWHPLHMKTVVGKVSVASLIAIKPCVLCFADIRQQLNEQLKCLDYKLETQCAMVQDIQEYFRRRADVESEYSKNLEKLVRTTTASCKAEKLRCVCWLLVLLFLRYCLISSWCPTLECLFSVFSWTCEVSCDTI